MGGPPSREAIDAYVVFAQRPDARLDIAAWDAHAERFFATRLGLADDMGPATGETPRRIDRVRFVVSPNPRPAGGSPAHSNIVNMNESVEAPGIRAAAARPTEESDLARAAEATGGDSGLAHLARRCPTVWIVPRDNDSDRLALRLAAILASVFLGPILDEARAEIFGVKTARAKLDALAAGPKEPA